jgi:hypothetical protein
MEPAGYPAPGGLMPKETTSLPTLGGDYFSTCFGSRRRCRLAMAS